MKKLLLLAALMSAVPLAGQQNRYEQSMLRAIERMNSASSINEYQDAANMFERIAQAEQSEWLPLYHAGYTYIMIAVAEPDDLRAKDRYLDRAQEFVDRALKIAPEESELFALQAFIYPIRMSIDPARGMELFDRLNATLNRAIRLNPENPRGHYLRAVTTLNIPEAFGGGPAAAKPFFVTAKEKFDNFRPASPLWPDWGKEHNQEELNKL
jgi:tetratricopeptide (TPR) repeat protein